jgi:hypothetical protein
MSSDFVDFDLSTICRSEHCDREDIHYAHEVVALKREPRPRSYRAPWLLPAPDALDDCIVRAVSDVRPKHFAALANDVENDFGSLGENNKSGLRRLHRRIRALVETGRILRIEIGDTLFAYLTPTSRIANDITYIRAAIAESISETSGRRTGLAFG